LIELSKRDLSKLDKVIYNAVISGILSQFNILYDLAYKTMKDILIEYHGVTDFAKGSPREIFESAYSVNLIHDDKWQHMRVDRNSIQHSYEELPKLEEFKDKIFAQYIPLFQAFARKIEKIKENN